MAVDVPEDIVVGEILSRLPVKSILRFRSVSKSWLSRLSSSDFRTLQLKRSYEIGFDKLIVIDVAERLKLLDFNTSEIGSDRLDYPLTCRLLNQPFLGTILGSVNGLVCGCSHNYDKVYIWNPCTTEYIEIPAFPYFKESNCAVGRYGFGYDASSDDYKLIIVMISEMSYADKSHDDGLIFLYSLRKGIWTGYEDEDASMSCFLLKPRGIFCNGAIHWASKGDILPFILSFRLADECFEMMSVPDVEYWPDCECFISVLAGSLCLSSVTYDSVIIWMMKDYGVGSSWTKLVTVDYVYIPLCFTRRGDIISIDGWNNFLVGLNRESNRVKMTYNCLDALGYVETLISPILK